MKIHFSRIDLPIHIDKQQIITEPRNYIANPKAVAAQTFKSNSIAGAFNRDAAWATYANIFSRQYRAPYDLILHPDYLSDESWIMYPYAISNIEGCCSVVWTEKYNNGFKVRHVRVYESADLANTDNSKIFEILKSFYPNVI